MPGNDGSEEFACASDISKRFLKPIQSNSFYKHILASTVGSVVATVVLNPIAVVKVKIQNVNPLAVSKTVRYTIQHIIKEKGIIGFYAGTPMGIMMAVPNTVLYMTAYEEVKVQIRRKFDNRRLNHLIPGIAGACARMFAVTITSPLELIRTIQIGGVNKGTFQIAREIVINRGYSGLYGGWTPTVLRDCPFSAMYWYMFESLRPVYSRLFSRQSISADITDISYSNNINSSTSPKVAKEFSMFATFASGATSGMLAALCTHPFDVIKTQQQMAMMTRNVSALVTESVAKTPEDYVCKLRSCCVAHGETLVSTTSNGTIAIDGHHTESLRGSTGIHAHKNYTVTDRLNQMTKKMGPEINVRSLYSQGGISALYRGLSMRLVSVIPASAIMVTIYEKIKSIEF